MLAFINSTNDLILIALVVLILFGANKIPEMMRGLGQGMRELKKGLDFSEEVPSERADEEARRAETRARIEKKVRARLEAESNQGRQSRDASSEDRIRLVHCARVSVRQAVSYSATALGEERREIRATPAARRRERFRRVHGARSA